MTRVIGRVLAIAFAVVGVSISGPQLVSADEVGGEEIEVPPRAETPAPEPVVVTKEVPVSAPPPPFVELERRSIGAGLGLAWGQGTIYWEGQQHPFRVKGVRVGDVGLAKMIGEGHVQNLEKLEDFAGTYVAVGAGATAGKGGSAVTMRNEHGVVVSLRSQAEGMALNLGAEGFQIELQ